MQARIIERASGQVVGTVEADNAYGLWLALLDWAESQGVPRFKAPAFYRSERVEAEGASPQPAPKPTARGKARPVEVEADAAAPATGHTDGELAPPPKPTATRLIEVEVVDAPLSRPATSRRPRRKPTSEQPPAEQLRLL